MASFSQTDLTPDEKENLQQIRKRKAKILEEIEAIKAEMSSVNAELDSLDVVAINDDLHGTKTAKTLSVGRKKFNMDPLKGMEFLMEAGVVGRTAEAVADFLHKGEGLNKKAVGDYLGEKAEFNLDVLARFVLLHDFTDLILVQALRQFLWSFLLPGEAQKIDRMMEAFSKHYVTQNPNIFTNSDTCYVLSFAIIMLNTTLHNENVQKADRTSKETFVHQLRGIDDGKDLPLELLESLYDSIRTEPFKIPVDDGNDLMHTFFNPDREGWLLKQGAGGYRGWKRRWFILNDKCLYYFEFTTDKEPRGIIPLENVEVRAVDEKGAKDWTFEIASTTESGLIKACKTDSDGRVVEGRHSVYRMAAASDEERDAWISAIRESISLNPRIQDVLSKSKAKQVFRK